MTISHTLKNFIWPVKKNPCIYLYNSSVLIFNRPPCRFFSSSLFPPFSPFFLFSLFYVLLYMQKFDFWRAKHLFCKTYMLDIFCRTGWLTCGVLASWAGGGSWRGSAGAQSPCRCSRSPAGSRSGTLTSCTVGWPAKKMNKKYPRYFCLSYQASTTNFARGL